MASTYNLSRLDNFHQCRVGWTEQFAIEALAEAVMSSWDSFDCVKETAEGGIVDADFEIIQGLIEERPWLGEPSDDWSWDTAVAAYVEEECERRVEEAKREDD